MVPYGTDAAADRIPRQAREYSAHRSGRHGSSAARGSSRSAKRGAFFAATSLWGFLVGVAGALASLRMSGVPMRASSLVFLGLGASLAVAIVGARVLASAYEESKRR